MASALVSLETFPRSSRRPDRRLFVCGAGNVAMKTYEIEISFDCSEVDWDALAALIERAPLVKRDPAELRRAISNSYAVCFAYLDGVLVGTARATSDGVYYATILDVCVHPGLSGQGHRTVGRAKPAHARAVVQGLSHLRCPERRASTRSSAFSARPTRWVCMSQVGARRRWRAGVLAEG